MRIKKHALKCVVSLLMTLVLVFGMVVATAAFDAEQDIATTGVTGTVYFKNTANWSTVNAYVWINGTTTSVQAWPGQAMTVHEGNIYKYTISGDYNMIIFNNGSGTQTGDISIPGAGKLYDYSTNTWSDYIDEPTDPTTPTTEPSQTPTQTPTQAPSGTNYVYFKNTSGWSSVNAYMWTGSGESKNGEWPGKAMTHLGEDIWQYEVTGSWNMIIFNNGSSQTGDLSYPGAGHVFDYSTSSWDVYDTSPITVKSVGSDLATPQYKGTDITLTADAVSTGGDVYYKFSVQSGSTTTALSDYTTKKSASWTPTAAGTYTIVYDFKDTAGNENQRTATYVINDDAGIAKPILKGVSPKPGQVKNGSAITFSANAAGGKTGTNLLFYKFTVKDANGIVKNVPYYTKNASYNFTPSTLGTFTVTVSVQNSENELIERTFTYTSVTNVDDNTDPTLPTVTPTTPTTGNYLKGDSDENGDVSILDATAIQMYLAKYDVTINTENADADLNGEISILDATAIQMYLAKLYPDW